MDVTSATSVPATSVGAHWVSLRINPCSGWDRRAQNVAVPAGGLSYRSVKPIWMDCPVPRFGIYGFQPVFGEPGIGSILGVLSSTTNQFLIGGRFLIAFLRHRVCLRIPAQLIILVLLLIVILA